MTNRIKLDEEMLNDVTGGALRWQGGKVWPKDNPTHVYTFTDYEAATDYIKNNWPGGTHNESTLEWLEAAGLVHKAYNE